MLYRIPIVDGHYVIILYILISVCVCVYINAALTHACPAIYIFQLALLS